MDEKIYVVLEEHYWNDDMTDRFIAYTDTYDKASEYMKKRYENFKSEMHEGMEVLNDSFNETFEKGYLNVEYEDDDEDESSFGLYIAIVTASKYNE